MKFSLITEIEIHSSPEEIWSILMDFEAHPNWNPFISHIQGEQKVGEYLNVHLGGMKFKPKILVVQANRRFSWLGKFLMPGLFDGEHIFEIIPKDSHCVFKQSENFSGLLIGLVLNKLNRETRSHFEAMNKALKIEAEKRTGNIH